MENFYQHPRGGVTEALMKPRQKGLTQKDVEIAFEPGMYMKTKDSRKNALQEFGQKCMIDMNSVTKSGWSALK